VDRLTRKKRDGPPSRPIGAEALRLLAVRPLTRVELRRRLEQRGYAADEIEEQVERFEANGHLDDLALARHYIVSRSSRLGHGRARLLRELERRGVRAAVAAAAWEDVVETGELDPQAQLDKQIARRVARFEAGLDERAYRRVYNALLRAGFAPSGIVDGLRSHRAKNSGAGDDDEFA